MKECIDSLLPILALLVNKSFQIGYIREEWKNALGKHLLKKLGLEFVFPSCRPVSNWLSDHVNKVRPLSLGQSANRPFDSTETALLKVQFDILLNTLDFSTAFNTINHSMLLETLGFGFGVGGTALKCFTSYLSQRTQQVRIKGTLQEKKQLTTGVPKGSFLGPVLVTICVADLFQIIKSTPRSPGICRWP